MEDCEGGVEIEHRSKHFMEYLNFKFKFLMGYYFFLKFSFLLLRVAINYGGRRSCFPLIMKVMKVVNVNHGGHGDGDLHD